MGFLNKETLLKLAEELDVDLEGLSWGEQQAAVQRAMAGVPEASNDTATEDDVDVPQAPVEEPKVPERLRLKKRPSDEEIIRRSGKVVFSREMAETNIQLFKYEENLGKGLIVEPITKEEAAQSLRTSDPRMRAENNGTYRILGQENKDTIATSTLPKYNAGITWDPSRGELLPVVTWKGKRGYLLTHPTLPNVKNLLQESGYWYEFKDEFDAAKRPQNVWYAGYSLLCCDINATHSVIKRIEKKAADEKRMGW